MDLSIAHVRQLARGHRYCAREIAEVLGVSPRTLRRRWRAHRGRRPLGLWLRRLRHVEALRLLHAGHPVKFTAYTLHYAHPAAFIVAFRRTAGTTPGAYQAAFLAEKRRLAALRNRRALRGRRRPGSVRTVRQARHRKGRVEPPASRMSGPDRRQRRKKT